LHQAWFFSSISWLRGNKKGGREDGEGTFTARLDYSCASYG
jgi:hypothetical protein